MSKIFGVNNDAMGMCWLELGCLRGHYDKMIFQWKGFNDTMIKVSCQSKIEVSSSMIRETMLKMKFIYTE